MNGEIMSIKEMHNTKFPSYSNEEWNEAVEKTLKGKTVDSLKTNTYEDIVLKPLYSQEDVEHTVKDYPGQADFRRGSNSLGYISKPWKVAQTLSYDSIEQLSTLLEESFLKGQEAIAFELKEGIFSKNDEFESLLAKVYDSHPFSMNAGEFQEALLANLISIGKKQGGNDSVTGWIGKDPIAIFAETGLLSAPIKQYYDQWTETLKQTNQHLPKLQTILVDTTPFHNSGSNAVQELAIAVSTGVFHIQMLRERGMKLEEIMPKMVFRFSIGSNFFMEIAKLRAARILWSKITEAYGADESMRDMNLVATTSTFTKTIFDPYVNMLRAGNEAFAAVLGGVQYLEVSSYNEPLGTHSSFADRVARNTQHILREEVHLQKVVDPAGGSWYVESLTKELAVKAWELFIKIEELQDIYNALKKGFIQSEILSVCKRKQKDTFYRKQSIIGTNVYANLNDTLLESTNMKSSHEPVSSEPLSSLLEQKKTGQQIKFTRIDKENAGEMIEPLTQIRLAEPFEKLRITAINLEGKLGGKPAVGLLSLGELRKHKARSDYMAGLLAVGGIVGVKSEEIFEVGDAFGFVQNTKLHHYVICGDNEQYSQSALEIVKKLKNERPNIKVFLAGLPDTDLQAQLKEAGLEDFIHVKSNSHQVLASFLQELEVKGYEA